MFCVIMRLLLWGGACLMVVGLIGILIHYAKCYIDDVPKDKWDEGRPTWAFFCLTLYLNLLQHGDADAKDAYADLWGTKSMEFLDYVLVTIISFIVMVIASVVWPIVLPVAIGFAVMWYLRELKRKEKGNV